MKILAIGNSFSVDATRYLHQIARNDGVEIKVVNLYIGGCSLKQHAENIAADAKNYHLYFNGFDTGFMTTVREALQSDEWDVVTLQQASHESTDYALWQPYLGRVAEVVRQEAPSSSLWIHKTWAYEEGCERLQIAKCRTRQEMYERLSDAYAKAATEIKATGIIPCGDVMERLMDSGIAVHRDTFHARYGAGRYALGLTWYRTLTGNDVSLNTYHDFDEEVTENELALIQKAVNTLA